MSADPKGAIPLSRPTDRERRLGEILESSGKLCRADIERILQCQRTDGLRFGDTAVELGMVSREDVQFALARQYGFPYVVNGDSRVSEELVAGCQPLSAQAETLRALRSELALRWFASEPRHTTLAVIGVEENVGRSYICANLAIGFAQLGARTLLIDADMRNPRQHEIFDLDSSIGLSSMLANRGEQTDLRQLAARSVMSSFLGLTVLVAGPLPPNPQELLGRRRFVTLLDEASAHFDVILLDTPAAARYADARTIAVRAKGAGIVARKDATGWKAASRLCSGLTQLGVTMVGSVLARF
jgi:protein-tyrosine kinase